MEFPLVFTVPVAIVPVDVWNVTLYPLTEPVMVSTSTSPTCCIDPERLLPL